MFNWQLSFSHKESVASNELISFYIEAKFEEVKMKGILNIDGLFTAIRKQGYLPIFTCDCGTFECGGYYMKVEHLDKGIILKNRYRPIDNPTEKDIIDSCEYNLTWEDLYIIANAAFEKVIELKETFGGYDICCGTFGEGLLGKVNDYEGTLREFRNKYGLSELINWCDPIHIINNESRSD